MLRDRVHRRCKQEPHQLTHDEEEPAILSTYHRSEYQSLPPSQIVPLLADKGVYLASESSFYRVLKKHHEQHHRGRMKSCRPAPAPTIFTATGPNQLWSWDISSSASVVRGQHWYLYLIMDIYTAAKLSPGKFTTPNRVSWLNNYWNAPCWEKAAGISRRTALRQRSADDLLYAHSEINRTGHADVLQSTESKQWQPLLGIAVPHREILPGVAHQGLCIAERGREWMLAFEQTYNEQHLHSGTQYVTPAD